MKVVITGGGTGGHLYPGLAIADELIRQDQDTDICFVGTSRGLEARVVPARNYRLETISARGLTRKASPLVIRDLWCLCKGACQSLKLMKRFKPDIAVGTGGYVSAPVVWAAQKRKVPTLLQEQNSFPGMATRWLAGKADRVHLNFMEAAEHLDIEEDKIRHTGNPVTMQTTGLGKEQAAAEFGLSAGVPTLLIVGGSQGAHSINQALLLALPHLSAGLQILWQCGKHDAEQIQGTAFPENITVKVLEYIDNMAAAYTLADLALCRAGAMTLTELALFGVPAVLVPLPIATGDHQRKNAAAIQAAGAARMILDRDLQAEGLAGVINGLIGDKDTLAGMSAASQKLARPDAAREIAASIYELIENTSR